MAAREPENFEHLTPPERLFIARNRLGETAGTLRDLFWLTAQRRAYVSSDLTHDASPAADYLLRTVVHYEVVQLCRLWDGFDAHGFSLPTLRAILDAKSVRTELQANVAAYLKYGMRSPSEGDVGGKTEEHIRDFFDDALGTIREVENSDQLKRVRNYRDKHIAHPIYATRAERRSNTQQPSQTDVEYIVESSVALVWLLQVALLVEAEDFKATRVSAEKEVRSFFERVSIRPHLTE